MSKTLLNTSIELVTEKSGGSAVDINQLRTKTLGMSLLLMGIAENRASSLARLLELQGVLEEELFNPNIVKHLTDDQKLERYSLVNDAIRNSASYIRDVVSNVNWDDIETRLTVMRNSAEVSIGDGGKDGGPPKDLSALAQSMIEQLANKDKRK